MQPHGAAMTQRPSHTPPTAPATLGDGCPRLAGSGYGPPRCSLISSAQIRRGCCPPPARMTPAASDHCNPPRQRGSNLLPLLSGFGQRTVPPYSTSWAPAGAAAHSFVRCLHSLASSTVRDEDQHDRSRSNTPDPLAFVSPRPRWRRTFKICEVQALQPAGCTLYRVAVRQRAVKLGL